jgi:glycosyltransferase involved in cell wall biosynthesis
LKIKQKHIHIAGDVNYVAFLLFWKKIVITVHDLNHYEELSGFRKKVYGLIWFYLPLLLADKIVVISPFTKTQLLRNFKVDESKILLIPNSYQPFSEGMPIMKKGDAFVILCIGGKKNKNIRRLIESLDVSSKIQIRIVGEQPKEIVELLSFRNISFSIVSNITKSELQQEYNRASMLYFASTSEGFGLPILEAQSCGLPVLTSNTTSMPFVAGKGAICVNPFSVSEIRSGIETIMNSPAKVDELIRYGYDNLSRFSREKFNLSYLSVYKEVFNV